MDGSTVIGFTMVQRTRVDTDFYSLMGRFFGSRMIATTLGMPIYDDEYRTWWLILNAKCYPVACGSVECKPGSRVASFKSAWVDPEERGKKLYDWLFSSRLEQTEKSGVKKITSTATEMSKHTHERYGFCCVGKRGKYYTYWKEVEA